MIIFQKNQKMIKWKIRLRNKLQMKFYLSIRLFYKLLGIIISAFKWFNTSLLSDNFNSIKKQAFYLSFTKTQKLCQILKFRVHAKPQISLVQLRHCGQQLPARLLYFFHDNLRNMWFGVAMLKVYFSTEKPVINEFSVKFILLSTVPIGV